MRAVLRSVVQVIALVGACANLVVAQTIDRDRDGIPDTLEADLARRYVPQLRPYSVAKGCYASTKIDPATGNEYLPRLIYRARYPSKGGIAHPDFMVITFEALYDEDCGHPYFGFKGHQGDNEPFMLFLKYDYARNDWAYDSLSTTAHWRAGFWCESKEAIPIVTAPGTTSHHPNVWVGYRKNSNHVDTSWEGCFDNPLDPFNDNDRIKFDGYIDLPGPSRLFNVGEPYVRVIDDLAPVRPDWKGQSVWEHRRFFEAGYIAQPLVSMSIYDWRMLTRPDTLSDAPWDSHAQQPCTYELSSSSVTVGPGGGTDVLSLLATANDCGWRMKSQDDWISVNVLRSSFIWSSSGTVGAGSGEISFSVPENPSSSSRTGTVSIGPLTLTVTQNGADCAFSALPASFERPAYGGSGQVAITAGASDCAWTASSNASWITLSDPASGSGSSTFGFAVAANTSSVSRSGTISVGGLTIPVNQAGVGCTIELQPASVTAGRGSTTGTVAVSASPGDCSWTATSHAPWLTVSPVSGSGSGSVSYAVAANFTGGDRTGTIGIGGRTFTVSQQGNPAPVVAITTPANGLTVARGTTIQIAATATDADGIAKVEFYVDNTLLSVDTAEPYTATWPNVAGGLHTIAAKAFDPYGMSATSAGVAVGVSNLDGLTFSPAAPRVGQTVAITVHGADACGAVELNFGDGEAIVYATSTLPITRTHMWTQPGTKTVTAIGHGNCFGRISASLTIAGNDGPAVAITAPAPGAAVLHPASVTIAASATDSDGVSRVEIYADGLLLGAPTSAPYQVSWQPPAGQHRLVAIAYDSLNVASTSPVVAISVTHVGSITFNPASPVAGQPTAVTVAGSGGCGALEINYGDGTAITYALNGLPTTQSHAWPAAGSYTITATGHGNCVGVRSTTLTVSTNPPPSVSLTGPTTGAAFTAPATIGITAAAADAHGIARVDFYSGATLLGSSSTAPYAFTWSGVGAGAYNLSAVAYDGYGVSASSSAVSVLVSNAQVTGVAVSSPRTQSAVATVTVSGTSPCGAVEVNYGDGTAITYATSTLPVSFSHVWTTGGTKVVTARGHGNCSGQVSTTIYVNYTPSIAITAPASGNTVLGPATFAITTGVGDPDGSVTRVDFYANGAYLGASLSSPFTLNWSNIPNGTYHLAAVATDNAGAQTLSSTVVVYVVNGGPSLVTSVSVSPASPAAGQAATITVFGTNPCGAIYLDYGDGTIIYHPVSSVPSSFAYVWSSSGTKTIIAQGMGNCAGQASTVVTVR